MTVVQQLPLEQLETGCWYVGRGRNCNVGLWDGECFLVIGKEGVPISWAPRLWETHWTVKHEPYYTEATGCFQPFMRIDEGRSAEPMDDPDGTRSYAKRLSFCVLP